MLHFIIKAGFMNMLVPMWFVIVAVARPRDFT